MDKIFQCGVKRRRSLFIIILLVILLLSIYILNKYMYSYRENYTLKPNEVFAEPIEVKGAPGVEIPTKLYFQMSELADIYVFDEQTYRKYYNKADFPESYYDDAVAFQRSAKKIEVEMSTTPGVLYVVVKMPSEEKMTAPSASASLYVEYKPLEPFLYMLTLLDAILIPLLLLRVYVLGKKTKVLRMQLSLDLDSLSDEDRVRLGLPPRGRPAAPPVKPAESPSTPAEPLPPHPEVIASYSEGTGAEAAAEAPPEVTEAPPPEEVAGRRKRKGYITPEEL